MTVARITAEEIYAHDDALALCRARYSEKRVADAGEGDVMIFRVGETYVGAVHLGTKLHNGRGYQAMGYVKPGAGYVETGIIRWWRERLIACFDAGADTDIQLADKPAPALLAAE